MDKIRLIVLILVLASNAKAQNLFPVKLYNCNTESFCLDCGDKKANVDSLKLKALISNLISDNNLEGVSCKIMFQILVDLEGKGCVLSHSDLNNIKITRNIISSLNSFNGWIPATKKRKKVQKSSINMSFEIINGKINAKIERFNVKVIKASIYRPIKPLINNLILCGDNETIFRIETDMIGIVS